MRVSGNTPYIRTPRVQKRSSKRTLVIMLVTILLPPLGLILVWRVARCALRGKVLISALGALVMVLAFALYIGNITPAGVDVLPIRYQYLSATPAPASPDANGVIAPPPSDENAQNGEEDMQVIDLGDAENAGGSDIIPANPATE